MAVDCAVGNRTLKHGEKYENTIRTDKCSGINGRMSIEECRLPGKNKTISGNEKLQEVIDGVTNYYTCEPYGYEGIIVTHTSSIKNIQIEGTSINPGVCNKGSMMWLPNQQWDEGDYVKKCNPDTLKVDVIACRSFEGTFIPPGSNRTTERFEPSVGNITSITECIVNGDEAHLKQTIYIRPENEFEGCVAYLQYEDVAVKVGENKIVDMVNDDIVVTCVKEDIFRVKVACWGPKGDSNSAIQIDESTVVEGRELVCKPAEYGGAKLVRVNLGSELNCDGRRLNVTWEKKLNELTCQLVNGVPTVKVVACKSSKMYTRMSEQYRIPVGEMEFIWQQGRHRCVLNANGTASIQYVAQTCEDGKRKLGEEWRDADFVKACVHDNRYEDSDDVMTTIKACGRGNNTIPVGEQREIVSEAPFSGMELCKCIRLDNVHKEIAADYPNVNVTFVCGNIPAPAIECNNGTVKLGETVSVDGRWHRCDLSTDGKTAVLVDLEPAAETKTASPETACANGKRINEKWRDGISAFVCKLENNIIVEPVIALTGCFDTEVQIEKAVETPLGEIAFLGGLDRRCTMNEAGKAEWVLLENKCENGKMEGEEWNVSFVIKACERDHLVADRVVMIVVVKSCVVENVAFPVGKSWKIPTGTCKCERTDGLTGAASVRSAAIGCVGISAINVPESTSTTRSTTTKKSSSTTASTTSPLKSEPNLPKRSASGCTMDDLHKERVDGDFVMACKSTTAVVLNKNVPRWIYTAIRCITPDGDKVLIGESKKIDLGAYKCAKSGRFPFAELTFEKKGKRSYACKKREGSATGQLLGEGRTENGVRRVCTDNLELEATLCFVPHDEGKENDALFFGEVYRGKKQYGCERRGEYDAELVVKSFSQLCEEGDMSVDSWVEDAVLRDCVRTGNKHTVHARMCVLGDGRIIAIGQNISYEFETLKCEKEGEFNAKYVEDQSKIDIQYFMTPGTCKNGKRVGDEWTEKSVRRACRDKKGEATIVDLGCEHFPGTPDSPLLAVGGKAEWASGVTGPITTLYCEAGKPFCAAVAHFGERERDTPDKVRECANGRFEGETWEAENVQRTCSELDDKLEVVAMHCVVGNETLEIGQLWLTSESSSIECVRVGEHDAAAVVTLFHPYDKECENGKRISEDWTDKTDDGPIRKSCRVRDKRATIVVLGCVLDDGRILEVGETETKTNTEPGWELYEHTHCAKNADNVVKLVVTQDAALKEDKKKPCGENEYGAIWATKSFLKKCKVTDDNYLSAATIGCVTVKGTHMLEGQYLVEDDYNIKCSRNEDDKLEMHYSFTVTEK